MMRWVRLASSSRMTSHARSSRIRWTMLRLSAACARLRPIASSRRRWASVYSQIRTSRLFHSAIPAHLLVFGQTKSRPPRPHTLCVSMIGSNLFQIPGSIWGIQFDLFAASPAYHVRANDPRVRDDLQELLSTVRAADPDLSAFVSPYSLISIIHALALLVKRPRARSPL